MSRQQRVFISLLEQLHHRVRSLEIQPRYIGCTIPKEKSKDSFFNWERTEEYFRYITRQRLPKLPYWKLPDESTLENDHDNFLRDVRLFIREIYEQIDDENEAEIESMLLSVTLKYERKTNRLLIPWIRFRPCAMGRGLFKHLLHVILGVLLEGDLRVTAFGLLGCGVHSRSAVWKLPIPGGAPREGKANWVKADWEVPPPPGEERRPYWTFYPENDHTKEGYDARISLFINKDQFQVMKQLLDDDLSTWRFPARSTLQTEEEEKIDREACLLQQLIAEVKDTTKENFALLANMVETDPETERKRDEIYTEEAKLRDMLQRHFDALKVKVNEPGRTTTVAFKRKYIYWNDVGDSTMYDLDAND